MGNPLALLSTDGVTTIVDGVTDMFKIVATGTMTVTVPALGFAGVTLSLPGLGTQILTPATLFFMAETDPSNVASRSITQIDSIHQYAANSSGGGSVVPFVGSAVSVVGSASIISGTVTLQLNAMSAYSSSVTFYARYYVLFEVGM